MFKALKKKSLISSILTVSSISIIAKVIGFLREGFIAAYFGTNIKTDIFFLAYSSISILAALIGMSIGIAYLPIFNNNEKIGTKHALQAASKIINQIFIASLIVLLLIFVFSQNVSWAISPSYSKENNLILSNYIRIISSGLFFLITTFVLSSILNAQKRFGIAELIGLSYSITVIVGLLLLSKTYGIEVLAYCVPVSALLSFVILVFIVFKNRGDYVFNLGFSSESLKLVKLAGPVFIGTSTIYLGQLIDRIIGATLNEGAVSAISFSGNIHGFVNVLFIASIVNVFYTEFSLKTVNNDIEGLLKTWKKGIVIFFLTLVPVTIIMFVFSPEIVRVLFKRGSFNEYSVLLTSDALSFYVLGSSFYGIRELTTRVFYTLNDTKTPMINGLFFLLLDVILTYSLSRFLGVKGITLASSVAAVFSCVFLIISLKRKFKKFVINDIYPTLLKILLSGLIMICVVLLLKEFVHLHAIIKLLIISITSLLIFYILLILFKCDEIYGIYRKIVSKYFNTQQV